MTKMDYRNSTKTTVLPYIPIEAYIEYSIIRKNEIGTEKLSLDIRLLKEYKKSELEQFAHYIKDDFATKSYQRIFLTYYLPNMEVGKGAWATTHFNPNLEVFISSPYFDDTKKDVNPRPNRIQDLITEYSNKASEIEFLGFWRQNEDYISVIFKKNRNYYLNEININNKSKGFDYELIVGTRNSKQTFVIKELLYPKNENGTILIGDYTDYYVIESNGDLALYDEFGIIEKYSKISPKINL